MAAFVFCVVASGLGGSRKGRAREPERHSLQRSGRIPEGRGGGWEGKVKKNFYREFAGGERRGERTRKGICLKDLFLFRVL